MPTRSPAQEPLSPFTNNDISITLQNFSQSEKQPFLTITTCLHGRQLSRHNRGEHGEAAARNLQRTLPTKESILHLQLNTSTEQKVQSSFMAYLPEIFTDYNSPDQTTKNKSDEIKLFHC